MANDEAKSPSSYPAGGGSRAAKKRRKKMHKLSNKPASDGASHVPWTVAPKPPATEGAKNRDVVKPNVDILSRVDGGEGDLRKSAGGAKRKRDDNIRGETGPPTPGKQEPTRIDGVKRPGVGSSNGESGGKRSGESSSASWSAAMPTVIDASKADDRSRLLLELDVHGVLSDHDVESGLKARQLLQWMIAPLTVEEFYDTFWERNALVVRGRDPDYFDGWLGTADIQAFVSGQSMQYGVDLDVTNYVNRRRITLNPSPPIASGTGKGASKKSTAGGGAAEGGAGAVVTSKYVWQKFREGCSLRMPCPQKFSDPLHRLLSALEEEFGCMVGSNVYLTPPRSQGFAPHWDDIEAFLLQIEGKKRWRVYRPADEASLLPRLSSSNLTDEQAGEPVLEVVLEPGDLLYFPRGWIHQAETVGDEPSLHITVSAMQANCWGDLVETVIPQAVASTIQSSTELRRGLPRDYLEFMGAVHSEEAGDKRREAFKKQLRRHLDDVVNEAVKLLDAASDQMGKRYISDRLPLVLTEYEEVLSVVGRGEGSITPLTRLRMAKRGCARLVLEDGVVVVYHCMDNARVHHGHALSPLEFELDDGPAIEVLLSAYPGAVRVADLPHPPTEDLDDKVAIATALYKEGFLLVVDDEDEDKDKSSVLKPTTRVAPTNGTPGTASGERRAGEQDEAEGTEEDGDDGL